MPEGNIQCPNDYWRDDNRKISLDHKEKKIFDCINSDSEFQMCSTFLQSNKTDKIQYFIPRIYISRTWSRKSVAPGIDLSGKKIQLKQCSFGMQILNNAIYRRKMFSNVPKTTTKH